MREKELKKADETALGLSLLLNPLGNLYFPMQTRALTLQLSRAMSGGLADSIQNSVQTITAAHLDPRIHKKLGISDPPLGSASSFEAFRRKVLQVVKPKEFKEYGDAMRRVRAM